MNEFFLHEQLCALESVANQYPAGRACGGRIREAADRIASRVYRVAVIGEFKKGKSSLINALLGSEILPTDILPMTAAINRVTYGERKRIIVRYKDGGSEERTLEELLDFGTKYDARRAETAKTVREIEVQYPSVFCKNHIELIDTPGLNDSEHMTEVTLGILGEVDAAVFVTSAREPLSMTEQESILMLMGRPGIRHILFVITCIDVFRPGEEQDRVIETIRNRLMENTLSAAEERYGDSRELLEKSRRILKRPELYAVSSLLAMKGFVRDDEALLEESRFPQFKSSLLDNLTAAQSADMKERTIDAAEEVSVCLEDWRKAAAAELEAERARLEDWAEAFRRYAGTAQVQLVQHLQRMDAALARRGLPLDGAVDGGELESAGRKLLIARLAAIRSDTATDAEIRSVLRGAAQEVSQLYAGTCRSMACWTREEMDRVERALEDLRESAGMPSLRQRLDAWREETEFPWFRWTEDPVPGQSDLLNADVIQTALRALRASLRELGGAMDGYIRSWRVILLRQVREDGEHTELLTGLEAELRGLRDRRSALELSHRQNRRQVETIRAKLRDVR